MSWEELFSGYLLKLSPNEEAYFEELKFELSPTELELLKRVVLGLKLLQAKGFKWPEKYVRELLDPRVGSVRYFFNATRDQAWSHRLAESANGKRVRLIGMPKDFRVTDAYVVLVFPSGLEVRIARNIRHDLLKYRFPPEASPLSTERIIYAPLYEEREETKRKKVRYVPRATIADKNAGFIMPAIYQMAKREAFEKFVRDVNLEKPDVLRKFLMLTQGLRLEDEELIEKRLKHTFVHALYTLSSEIRYASVIAYEPPNTGKTSSRLSLYTYVPVALVTSRPTAARLIYNARTDTPGEISRKTYFFFDEWTYSFESLAASGRDAELISILNTGITHGIRSMNRGDSRGEIRKFAAFIFLANPPLTVISENRIEHTLELLANVGIPNPQAFVDRFAIVTGYTPEHQVDYFFSELYDLYGLENAFLLPELVSYFYNRWLKLQASKARKEIRSANIRTELEGRRKLYFYNVLSAMRIFRPEEDLSKLAEIASGLVSGSFNTYAMWLKEF